MIRDLARTIVRLVAVFVPAAYRDRFIDEWCAELFYEQDARRALERSLGAFHDAMATRRMFPKRRRRSTPMLFQDVRFALRSFLHRPWWTAVVLLTLAVGIGANTAIFSLFDAVLLKPLDYPASEQLVKIVGQNFASGETGILIGPWDDVDFAEAVVELTRDSERRSAMAEAAAARAENKHGMAAAVTALKRALKAAEGIRRGPRN